MSQQALRQAQEDQIWALSAMFFAVDGVVALAERGQWAEENFAALLPSLSRFNCEKVCDFYDHHQLLNKGREDLIHYFAATTSDAQLAYVLHLMRVARLLGKNQALLGMLKQGLQQAAEQIEYFGMLHDNLFARYADIYQKTASQIMRIRIYGKPHYLQQKSIADRVRSLLLCGVRAAALWQGNGGSRWQLLFGRAGIIALAKEVHMKT